MSPTVRLSRYSACISSLPIDGGSATIGRRMIRGAGALERNTTMGATASPSGCVERPLPGSPDRWSSGRLGSRAVIKLCRWYYTTSHSIATSSVR